MRSNLENIHHGDNKKNYSKIRNFSILWAVALEISSLPRSQKPPLFLEIVDEKKIV